MLRTGWERSQADEEVIDQYSQVTHCYHTVRTLVDVALSGAVERIEADELACIDTKAYIQTAYVTKLYSVPSGSKTAVQITSPPHETSLIVPVSRSVIMKVPCPGE